MYLRKRIVCFNISYFLFFFKKRASIDGNFEYMSFFKYEISVQRIYAMMSYTIERSEEKKKKQESACKCPIITVRVVLLMI